jgi:Flp pilus assembly protein TadD
LKKVAVSTALWLATLAGQSVDSIQDVMQSGNLAEAFRQVSNALAQHPGDAGLLNLRGVIHAQRNEISEARQDFERAAALAPALTPAWQNLARACQLTGSACAVSAWQRVEALKPGDPEARFSLASIYEQQGKYADSLRELGQLGDAPALLLKCADLAALHRLPEAVATARQLRGAADFTEADLSPLLPKFESHPALAVALIEALDARGAASPATLRPLVIAYEQGKRWSDARRTLERLASAEPANPQHLLELARVACQIHDFEGALGYLGHARDLTPADARVHFLFGMILVELKLPLDARKSLEKALALDPRNPEYNYAMGSVILNARDAASAIPYFRAYVEARPGDPKGHFALGVADYVGGDYDQCRAEMQSVRNDPATQVGAAYFLGRVARVNDNLDEAAASLDRAIKLSPSFAEAYTELARVRLRQDRQDDARAAIERALAIRPESFQANSVLLALYERNHDPRAEEQAARIRKLDEERGKTMELMLRSIEVKPY